MNRRGDIKVSLSAWELLVLCEALERYPAHEAHKAALLNKLDESAERQMAARRRNRPQPTKIEVDDENEQAGKEAYSGLAAAMKD